MATRSARRKNSILADRAYRSIAHQLPINRPSTASTAHLRGRQILDRACQPRDTCGVLRALGVAGYLLGELLEGAALGAGVCVLGFVQIAPDGGDAVGRQPVHARELVEISPGDDEARGPGGVRLVRGI